MKKIILLITLLYSFLSSNHFLLANTTTSYQTPKIERQNLEKAIQQIHKMLLKDLQNNQKDCGVLRRKMDLLIDALGYDRIFILGKNDKYYREGMHQEFERAPAPIKIKIERRAIAEQLELAHVDLYYCDKNLYSRIARFTDFVANRTPEKMADLQQVLNQQLTELTDKAQRRLKNKKRQQAWLQTQLVEMLQLAEDMEERALLSWSLKKVKANTRKTEVVETVATNSLPVIAKESKSPSFLLYPNPNQGTFQVRTAFKWTAKAILEVVDITGRIILTKQLTANSSNEIKVQLPMVEKGVYFVRLVDGQEQWQKMFILE